MDPQTARYYEENAASVYGRHRSAREGVERYFGVAFPPGSSVLDIGAGSGRDLEALLERGYQSIGIEPCRSLRELVAARNPGLAGHLLDGCLPGLSPADLGRFDGILCSAVFMHIPEGEQAAAAENMRDLLKPGGRLLLCVPQSRPDVSHNGRDPHGRLFTHMVREQLEGMFARLGFLCLGKWEDEDSMGRAAHRWTTLLFQLD